MLNITFTCSVETKCLAYISIVRPLLEYIDQQYVTPILTEGHTKYRDGIQRRAAHWIKSDYRYNSSVTSMLEDLQWPSL